MAMEKDIKYILMDGKEIESTVARIASEIDRDYRNSNKKLLLLCILKGSVVFMGELMKKISLPIEIDFMRVSSYGSGVSTSGRINIILDIHRNDMSDIDIIIIEDIIDSGKTLSHLVRYLKERGANSVRTCTLLDKPDHRTVDFQPDYSGKEIPDKFVVGFGLDYNENYRNLPFVGILKPEIYS